MIDTFSPDAVFMLSMLVRSALIVLVAALIVATLKTLRAGAAARHVTWLFAFAALAVLPLLSRTLPAIVIPLPHAIASIASPDLSSPGDHPRGGADLAVWIWSVYALVASAMLAKLVLSRFALAALWRRAHAKTAHADLAELAQRAGVRGAVVLRFADETIAPMTWDNCILLPVDSVEWPQVSQRDVLLHKLSHMARRDALTQTLAAIVRAIFWFNPAVWYALRALRLEQEQACDERVVAAGAAPIAYAQTLFDIATQLTTPPLGMGVSTAMVQRSDLQRRVLAILNPARHRALAAPRVTAIGAIALAAFALIAAARPMDEALILPPLGPLRPLSAQLPTPLPPLATPLHMPDEPGETPHR